MIDNNEKHVITWDLIDKYADYLHEQERAPQTIQKYSRDLNLLRKYLNGRSISKIAMIDWKEYLTNQYAAASVNTMLAAANGFFDFLNWPEYKIKPLKIQKKIFCEEERELTREEYVQLVNTAKKLGKERLSLLMQTICATGIRVSELKFITVQAVQLGRAEVSNKGKRRIIFLPKRLRRLLQHYIGRKRIVEGAIFVTKNGRQLDRSNIWREMKTLCKLSNIEEGKVFPHNLRHLFARAYYTLEKDLSRLADLLGHSSVSTTRLYTMESGAVHARQLDSMGLIIT